MPHAVAVRSRATCTICWIALSCPASTTWPAAVISRGGGAHRRAVDSLQLTATRKVATPVNWRPGDDCIIGAAVTDDEAAGLFPGGWTTVKPYLRIVAQPI